MAEAAVVAWVRGPGTVWKALPCASVGCSVRDVIYRHCQEQEVPVECFFVTCNGVLVNAGDKVQHGAVYSLEPRLRGGKGAGNLLTELLLKSLRLVLGTLVWLWLKLFMDPTVQYSIQMDGYLSVLGFGSMLRALGAQIEKTTNREACRDLSGRRLRDVNHEKAMAEWVKQQAEREAEKEQRRLERLQRKLAEPAHCFTSPDYQRQCHEMAERLEDSVLKGMQAASSKMVSAEITETRKRPNKSKTDQETSAKKRKRKCFWLGMDGLEAAEGSSTGSSEDSSEDDSEDAPGTSEQSCCAREDGIDAVEVAADRPGSPRSSASGTHSESPEKLQCPVTEPGQGILENTGTEPEETPARKETESHEATEKDQKTGMSGGDRAAMVLSGEDRKSVPAANLEGNNSGDTALGLEAVDLSAFSSAAELESLGLERLKCELMVLGLKCGGTLQERAARLFSVRGLTKELIDPALFAKPSKGKKK